MVSWLKDAIFYQIYPTSFYDSNGDGVGDLKGIEEKLDYVVGLGVTAIWLNPFFKSPFMDGGYDVQDYCAVDERFGTMADFEALVRACKKRGLKIVLDLVIGHTSDKHAWFLASGKEERNAYSDYYIWTDSIFSKYKDKTIHGLHPRDGGFYINYYASQPALNFGFNRLETDGGTGDNYDNGNSWQMHYTDERLKPLREEILNVMRFWLDKGVDGFRVDMANSLVKGCQYDAKDEKDIEGLKWLWDILLGTIRKEYQDVVFISEWVNPENAVGKCGFDVDFFAHDIPCYNDLFRNEPRTNLLPAFEKGDSYFGARGQGTVEGFIEYSTKLHGLLAGKGYFSVPSGSHDQVRLAEKKDADLLKTVFAFLLTYKQVPFLYYGDELGIRHNFAANKDGGYIRTGARTPMLWTEGENGGFTTAKTPYLPTEASGAFSVETQGADDGSLLNTVKALCALRKEYSCLNADGALSVELCENGGYPLVYTRKDENGEVTVLINPGVESKKVAIRYEKLLYASNAQAVDGGILLSAKSFAVVKK